MRRLIGAAATVLGLTIGLPETGHPLALDVPGTHATLQLAVAAAALSVDVDNEITISVSPVTTSENVAIGNAFGAGRRLVIRPAAGLDRATIVSNAPTVTVLSITNAGHVTLQDLDILRNVTNVNHLVTILTGESVTIERCRIGTNAPTPGLPGYSNVFINYPTNVMLRNNILFARQPGLFDRAIDVLGFIDPTNSVRLYNNVLSDYRVHGIRIDAAIVGPLILLRNNVAVNHASLVPEPTGYRTQVAGAGPTVVTSHNVAFATPGSDETAALGAQSILGTAPPSLVLPKASAAPAFVALDWASGPPYDDNADFYRLVPGGPLHLDATHYGFTPPNAYPDVAVVDDIEKDPRPTGAVAHTDRGADQIELTTRVSVAPGSSTVLLSASPLRNPSGSPAIIFATSAAGRVRWELFDSMGRLLHAADREVGPGSRGVLEWDGASDRRAGILLYRVVLHAANGVRAEARGRLVVLR